MKILIAEDDFTSRKFLTKFLSAHGECDATINGMEALEAFMMAWDEGKPYDLICLDIMMPELDGVKTLKAIRGMEIQKNIEESKRAKIIMTTALNDTESVTKAFEIGCEAYAAKPIDTEKLLEVMRKLNLID